MADFPVLEVVAAPHGPAIGARLPLTEKFRIGRKPMLELTLRSSSVSREHCGVFSELGGWWLRDLGSSFGCLHNGVRVLECELHHGDFIEVARGFCFRFLTHEPDVDVHDPEQERDPGESQWQVYADWIHEHVDATRLTGLGPLAGDVARGELRVEWRNELPWKVTLRALNGENGDWPSVQRLRRLRAAPLGRFVRRLELDAGSFGRREFSSRDGARELVALFGAFPLLEHALVTNVAESVVEELQLELPSVEWRACAPLAFVLEALRPMQRVAIGGVELSEGQQARCAPGEVRLNDRARLTVRDQLGIIEVSSRTAFTLNDVTVSTAFVRPGDRLTLEPGVVLVVGNVS